ncbi:SEC10/PgrA surface exclusion domain-containing protein [Gemella sanguinis]|uniref:SEC10/PgrA surface exclusion domain-containing protein n=1 Tax=Gemella sanguinis TaxID=84135 RepID=UPI0028E32848|nr:SEC10/PgrA surface exclusion domain-containing protein [Gemella sanguinis]
MKQKQRFSLRKNKIGTASVLLGLTILGGASYTSGDASAAETTTNTEATQPAKTTNVTDNQVLDAKKAVDNKKAEVSNTQKEINKVQGTIDNKTEVKKTLTEEKGQLTKDIADAKNTTPEDVAKIEDKINAQKQNKADKSKELEQAKANEAEKQTVAQEKAKEVEKAQENVTKADKDVEAKKQALDPKAEEIAKDNVAKATADLANKEAKQKEAKTNLDTAKAFDADLSEKKVNANADVIAKAKDKEDKTSDVTKATKAQKDAKEAVENAFAYPTKVVTTPEWIKAFKEFKAIDEAKFDRDGWKKANPQKPGESDSDYFDRIDAAWDKFLEENSAKRKEAIKKVIVADRELRENHDYNEIIEGYTNAKDNSVVYDVNNIPSDVLVEASQYFAQLINSAREELGITEKVKVHKDAVEFAREVAKSVVDNNIKTFDHFGRGINDAARKRGLPTSAKPGVDTTSQFYENLASSNFEGMKITKQQLFHEIYMAANGFLHEGPTTGHYQHAITLVRDKNVGIALSQVEGADFMQIHAIAINPATVKNGSYDAIYGPQTLLPNAVYEDKATLQAKLDKANNDLETAKAELNKATKALDTARAKVAELNAIQTKTPEAQAKYDIVAKAVKVANEEKEKAEKHLQFVILDKLAKENALNESLRVQREANDELSKVKLASDKAANDYNNAVNARIAKEAEISNITKKIAELVSNKTEIENKIAKRAENEARLIEIDKEITKLTDEITKLTAEEVKLKNTTSTLEKQLVDLENEYKRLLDIYTTERVPKAPIVEDLPSIDIQESTHTEDIEYRIIEKEDITIPVGEKVVKQAGKKGRKSVKTIKLYKENALIDEVLQETVIEDAVNEVILIGSKKPISNINNTQFSKLSGQYNERNYIQGNIQNSKLQDRKLHVENNKLPNTGQNDTGIASMIGLVALAVAAKLRERKEK